MKIFISRSIPKQAVDLLEEAGHQVTVWKEDRAILRDELLEQCIDADALVSMLNDRIDTDFFTHCKNIKCVSNYAVGYNNIDVKEATKRNIAIGNTPDVLTEATADLALSLLLNVSRRISPAFKSVKDGKWKGWEPLGFIGTNLRGKTLGIYGAGRIGQCMATTCHKAFGMKVIYTSRKEKVEFNKECSAKLVSFEELLNSSDVISLHSSLTKENMNIFNSKAFKKMKTGSYFINTARGEMHNEKDLYAALLSKKLQGAGLDVTNPEPMNMNSPLLKLENVVVTPHIGSATKQARGDMATLVARNIINALQKRPLIGDVNNLFYE